MRHLHVSIRSVDAYRSKKAEWTKARVGARRQGEVVVLRDDAFLWERYEPRKYVYRTEPVAILDLSLVLVGVGARRRGNWLWSDGIYA